MASAGGVDWKKSFQWAFKELGDRQGECWKMEGWLQDSEYAHKEALAGAQVLLDLFMSLHQQHAALEAETGALKQQYAALDEEAGALMGTVLDQDAELQLRWDMLVSLMGQKEAAVAENDKLAAQVEGRREECLALYRQFGAAKEEHAGKVHDLRRGFLSLCQRWEVAKGDAEAAQDRLAEKEEEVALLREEGEASKWVLEQEVKGLKKAREGDRALIAEQQQQTASLQAQVAQLQRNNKILGTKLRRKAARHGVIKRQRTSAEENVNPTPRSPEEHTATPSPFFAVEQDAERPATAQPEARVVEQIAAPPAVAGLLEWHQPHEDTQHPQFDRAINSEGGDGGSIIGLTPQNILMETRAQRVEAWAPEPSPGEESCPLTGMDQLPAAQTKPIVYRRDPAFRRSKGRSVNVDFSSRHAAKSPFLAYHQAVVSRHSRPKWSVGAPLWQPGSKEPPPYESGYVSLRGGTVLDEPEGSCWWEGQLMKRDDVVRW